MAYIVFILCPVIVIAIVLDFTRAATWLKTIS